ncbi:IS21 family transposase [Glutamicibacter ardleyensis]|nr:IS21 family transposase [Glutamicibacter ardleyensis]
MKFDRNSTLQRAWQTYVGSPSAQKKYGYSKFCELFAAHVRTHDLAATIHHEPGRAMQVDWAGQTLTVTDLFTRKPSKAYLFAAVLPYSGLVFARASLTMNLQAWIELHVQALEYFGGVPQLLIPDNAKTATYRPTRGDRQRVLTDRYSQLASHYGIAIVPARVKRPTDKAAIERAVQTANTRIIGYLSSELWSTIDELNAAIAAQVEEINDLKNPQGITKREIFAADERSHLGSLPEQRFTQVTWKQVKVGRNYHITTDYQHYSVPYRLAGQSLKVRLTDLRVTLFDKEHVVCEHPRKYGRKGQYSTLSEHVPPVHRNIANLWSRAWFLDRAQGFGPATSMVIAQVLDRHAVEAQGYLDCQNILDSLGRKGKARLEAACQQVLNINAVPTYTTLKRVLGTITSDNQVQEAPPAALNTLKPEVTNGDQDVFVRDGSYYSEEF